MLKIFSNILILFYMIALISCGGEEMEAKNMELIYKEEGVPVKIVKIEPRLFETELSYFAVLTGIEESVASAMLDDRVDKVLVNVGDYVKKDQILVNFPTDNPSAHYHQAKVAYDNAKISYDRIENLFQSGGISRQNYDNAKAQYDVAKANYDAVSQMVKVVAPMSGYVTKINVMESENVKRDDELVTISKIDKLKAKVWISEKEINEVKVGMPAVAIWQDNKIEGKVVRVDMAINQMSQAFGAVLEFTNTENCLHCGVTAGLKIKTYQNPQTIVVDLKNIMKDQDNDYVYVVNNGNAERRPIKQGKRQNIEVEVLEGLNTGDELIVEGQLLLEAASKLKIIE